MQQNSQYDFHTLPGPASHLSEHLSIILARPPPIGLTGAVLVRDSCRDIETLKRVGSECEALHSSNMEHLRCKQFMSAVCNGEETVVMHARCGYTMCCNARPLQIIKKLCTHGGTVWSLWELTTAQRWEMKTAAPTSDNTMVSLALKSGV